MFIILLGIQKSNVLTGKLISTTNIVIEIKLN